MGHSPKQNSSDDDENVFLNITPEDVSKHSTKAAFIAGRRRRRRFTAARRREVAAVRNAGACLVCRRRKCTHVLPDTSHPIPIKTKPSPPLETSEHLNSSSVESSSSLSTHYGAFQLDLLNQYIPHEAPINRYGGSFEEDPPAGWIADASYTSDSSRDPMVESLERLSPRIKYLSNIITPTVQEGKGGSLGGLHTYIEDKDDLSRPIKSFLQPDKPQKLQQYLPMPGCHEDIHVRPVRIPVSNGEKKPWHLSTMRETTQPPRSTRTGPKKKKKKKERKSKPSLNATESLLPTMHDPRPEGEQWVQINPVDATPDWPYYQQFHESQFTARTPFDYNNPPSGGISGFTSNLPAGQQPIRYISDYPLTQQAYTPQNAYNDSTAVFGLAPTYGAPQTPTPPSTGNVLQQMHVSEDARPMPLLGSFGPNDPFLSPGGPARGLDYGLTTLNTYDPMVNNSRLVSPFQGAQSVSQEYPSPSAIGNRYFTPASQSQIYSAYRSGSSPSTSTQSQTVENIAFPPATGSTYAASQPPTLTNGGTSEVTPNTPFDVLSNHSGMRDDFSAYSPNPLGESPAGLLGNVPIATILGGLRLDQSKPPQTEGYNSTGSPGLPAVSHEGGDWESSDFDFILSDWMPDQTILDKFYGN